MKLNLNIFKKKVAPPLSLNVDVDFIFCVECGTNNFLANKTCVECNNKLEKTIDDYCCLCGCEQ